MHIRIRVAMRRAWQPWGWSPDKAPRRALGGSFGRSSKTTLLMRENSLKIRLDFPTLQFSNPLHDLYREVANCSPLDEKPPSRTTNLWQLNSLRLSRRVIISAESLIRTDPRRVPLRQTPTTVRHEYETKRSTGKMKKENNDTCDVRV